MTTKDRRNHIRKYTTKKHISDVLEFIDNDGHTIFNPSAFKDVAPEELIDGFTDTFESVTGNHKETIYKDGQPVDAVEGVWGLEVVQWIASQLDQSSPCSGRGFKCRHLTELINGVIKEFDDDSTLAHMQEEIRK